VKAIVIREYGEPEVLELRDVPDPEYGPEDLLIDVNATAVNRADLLQRRGLYPQPGPKPQFEIPGLEFAGAVASAGSRVDGFAAGDRVMGILAGGGYAEKVVCHHRAVAKVPRNLGWREAAAVPEAFITAHDALTQCELSAGESVLVHAAGSGVGLAAIQTAKTMGATPIIGTASTDRKLATALELGLDTGIAYQDKDFADEVRRLTNGRGVDVIVDFVGAQYLERNVKSLAVRGRLIVIGLLGGITADLNLGLLLNRRLRVIGTVLRSRPLEEKALATRAFEKALLPAFECSVVKPIVDRVFRLADAAQAHSYMETNANVGKIVLEVCDA
jgi:putative PIG3 family NAD(P)H quinone oxidoreductase